MAKGKSGHLVVAVYDSDEDADMVLTGLKRMHHEATITLVDAARISKDEDGKVHVKEAKELTAKKGALEGAAIAGVFGLIFPPSLIVSAAVGGGVGALAGRLRDTGVKTDTLHKVGEDLDPQSVALATLVHDEDLPAVQQTMKALSGKLTVQPISDVAMKHLFIEEGNA